MTDSEQQTTTASPQFAIEKIYLKDVSFEAPAAPGVFTQEWKPDLSVDLNTTTQPVAENVYEVLLNITVTAKNQDKTAFLVEIKQAGIFTIAGMESDALNGMLGSFCPSILFPFAREAISDLVTKGGFPQLLLAPVNFDALYAQHLQQQQAPTN